MAADDRPLLVRVISRLTDARRRADEAEERLRALKAEGAAVHNDSDVAIRRAYAAIGRRLDGG